MFDSANDSLDQTMAIRAVLPSVHGDVPYLTMRSSSRHKEQRKLSFFPFFALVDGRRRPCDTLKVILSGHDLAGPRDVEPGNEKGQKVVGATSEVWPPVVVVFCGRSTRTGPATLRCAYWRYLLQAPIVPKASGRADQQFWTLAAAAEPLGARETGSKSTHGASEGNPERPGQVPDGFLEESKGSG